MYSLYLDSSTLPTFIFGLSIHLASQRSICISFPQNQTEKIRFSPESDCVFLPSSRSPTHSHVPISLPDCKNRIFPGSNSKYDITPTLLVLVPSSSLFRINKCVTTTVSSPVTPALIHIIKVVIHQVCHFFILVSVGGVIFSVCNYSSHLLPTACIQNKQLTSCKLHGTSLLYYTTMNEAIYTFIHVQMYMKAKKDFIQEYMPAASPRIFLFYLLSLLSGRVQTNNTTALKHIMYRTVCTVDTCK